MSKRSVVAGFCLMMALGACANRAQPVVAFNGPGWYLEKPRFIVSIRPEIFGGPYSYEACELERSRLPGDTASRMLCVMEKAPFKTNGPY